MHLSNESFHILLRVPSKKRIVAVSLNVCVVHIRPDFERTKERAHAPQLVVVHSVLPLSFVLFVYPNLPSSNYTLSCVHTQKILSFLINPFIVWNVARLKHFQYLGDWQPEQLMSKIKPLLYELWLLSSHNYAVLETITPPFLSVNSLIYLPF